MATIGWDQNMKAATLKLDDLSKSAPARRREALRNCIVEIERKAKRIARSGGVFSDRSRGVLARSISHEVSSGGEEARLTVGVKYGLIQEFGGTTRPHIIRPKRAKVLAWSTGFKTMIGRGGRSLKKGRDVMAFAREVHHPGSRIKPKRYSWKALEQSMGYVLQQVRNVALGKFGR